MFTFNRNYSGSTRVRSFGSGGSRLRSKEPLTMDQLRSAAPSIFAETAHESRSARYSYIPTIQVLEALQREGFQPFSVAQGGSRDLEKRNFTKHMIRLRHATSGAVAVGDSVPEIILINSHDGTSSYELMAGFFRLVCSNGLVVHDPSKGGIGLKVPHKGDIVGNVIEGSFKVLDETAATIDRIETMRALTLAPQEQAAFAAAAMPLRFDPENMPDIQPAQILRPRRAADVGDSLWLTFNRTQEALTQGGLGYVRRDPESRETQHRRTRPVNGVSDDVKLNKQLWALAESMAAIKSGSGLPIAA